MVYYVRVTATGSDHCGRRVADASPSGSDRGDVFVVEHPVGKLGVCHCRQSCDFLADYHRARIFFASQGAVPVLDEEAQVPARGPEEHARGTEGDARGGERWNEAHEAACVERPC